MLQLSALRYPRRLAVCLVVGLGALSLSRPAPAEAARSFRALLEEATSQCARLPALRFTVPPLLDANLDDWQGFPAAPVVTRAQSNFDADWSGPADCCARVRVGWDPDYLYVAVEVQDDELESDRDPLTDDAVELSLSADTAEPQVVGGRLSVALPIEVYEVRRRNLVTRTARRAMPVFGAEGTSDEKGGVYTVEARLAWSLVRRASPTVGATLGFDVLIHDANDCTGPESVLRWAGPWREGEEPLGVLALVDSLSEPPTSWSGLTALGIDRAYFLPGETGRVRLCTGLPGVEARGWTCSLATAAGPSTPLKAVGEWHSKLLTGWEWECPPAELGNQVVLTAESATGSAHRVLAAAETEPAEAHQVRSLSRQVRARALFLARSDLHGAKGAAVATYWWRHRELDGLFGDWGKPDKRPNLLWAAERLREFQQTLESEFSSPPAALVQGTTVRAYLSALDDSLQPYSVYLPPGSPHAEDLPSGYPLVVKLHGLGGKYSTEAPDDQFTGCVVVCPNGRGNTDYKAWGEIDALRVMDEILRDYVIDPNRVYLTGFSMGGTGCWQLGVHYPDRFAAIAPFCGNADHRAWRAEFGWIDPHLSWMSPLKDYLENLESNTFFAESLLNLPPYCVHGSADDYVPVQHSRLIVGRLRELGYKVTYDEQPGVGHSSFGSGTTDKVYTWLLAQRRPSLPRRVAYKTAWLRHSGAYWVKVERFVEPLRFAEIDAEADDANQIWVKTDNVRQFSLDLGSGLIDLTAPVTLIVDGVQQTPAHVPTTGRVSLERRGCAENGSVRWTPPGPQTGLLKRAGLEGPIEDALLSRFLVVYGTQGEAREDEVNKTEALRLDDFWSRWANARCRLKADAEVTAEDVQDSNLILFGNARSNLWVQKVNEALPVRFADHAVLCGERRFEGDDVGLKVCYPNPLNPERYVVVIGGTTWQGTLDANERFGNWFDWGLFDNRNWFDYGVFDRRTRTPESFLEVGFFDQDWRLDERYLWAGTDADRGSAGERRVPTAAARDLAGGIVYLSDLELKLANLEKGALGVDLSFAGRMLQLGSTYYRKGLGVHPNAEVVYDLGAEFHTFSAWVGPDLEGEKTVPSARASVEKVTFEVYGDGKLLAKTKTFHWDTKPERIYLEVTGVKELKLLCNRHDAKRWLFGDWDWADAKLTRPPANGAPGGAAPQTGDLCAVLDLDGEWDLHSFSPGEGLQLSADRELPKEQPAPSSSSSSYGYGYSAGSRLSVDVKAQVPGTVQEALLLNGKLEHPYRGKKSDDAEMLSEQEWWYHRSFEVPAEWQGRQVALELDGINYAADLWLNGQPIGSMEGTWERERYPVASLLKYGEKNLLAVRLCAGRTSWTHPPDGVKVPDSAAALGCKLNHGLRGMPKLVPLGIWRPVRLQTTGAVELRGPVVSTVSATAATARVCVRATLANHATTEQPVVVSGILRDEEGVSAPVEFWEHVTVSAAGSHGFETLVTLPSPQLWWPHRLGEAPGYTLRLAIRLGSGAESDRATVPFAVRTLRAGEDGSFVVNGRELPRLEGAVWLPLGLLLDLPRARYEHFVGLAKAAGVEAFRVWAGGLLETDEFYETCDRAGMLVVQDFPLTGTVSREVPPDRFLTTAAVNLCRLRNHPCLVAWAGGADLDLADPDTNQLVTALRDLCKSLDPDRPFFAQLPERGAVRCPPEPFANVAAAAGKELPSWTFSALPVAPPPADAADNWLRPGTDTTESEVWKHHGATPDSLRFGPFTDRPAGASGLSDASDQSDQSDSSLSSSQGKGDLLRDLLLGQWLRAPSSLSRPWAPNEAGRFWWQFGEPWPQFSSSLVDWSGAAKPAYYAMKARQAPLALLPKLNLRVVPVGDVLRVGGTLRSATAAVCGRVRLEVVTPALEVLSESEQRVIAAAGDTVRLSPFEWRVPLHHADRALFVRARFLEDAGRTVADELQPFATRSTAEAPLLLNVLWVARESGEIAAVTEPLRSYGIAVEVVGNWQSARASLESGSFRVVVADLSGVETGGAGELGAFLDACQPGRGLLLYGALPPGDEESLAALRRRMLVTLAPREPGEEPTPTTLADHEHPLFAGLAETKLPEYRDRRVIVPSPQTPALLTVGEGQALLVEGDNGPGRCLYLATELTSGWGRALRDEWGGFQPFLANALVYLGQLSHPEVRRLRRQVAASQPWRPFDSLPETKLEAESAAGALKWGGGQSASFTVKITNSGEAVAFFVTLGFESLSANALPLFGDNYFSLRPGESRTVPVRLTVTAPLTDPKEATLVVGAWNASQSVTLTKTQVGEPKAPPPTPSYPSYSNGPDESQWQSPDYESGYGPGSRGEGYGRGGPGERGYGGGGR